MFDKEYFDGVWQNQVGENSGSVSCEMHLRDGFKFRVREIDAQYDRFLLAEIFPPESFDGKGKKEALEKRKKPSGDGKVVYDQLAVPYDEIAYVIITACELEAVKQIGFSAETARV